MNRTTFYIYTNNWHPLAAAEYAVETGCVQTFKLDETLDSAAITLAPTSQSLPFEPYSLCAIAVNGDMNYYVIYQDDVVLSNKIKGTYTHSLSLIEPFKLLERYLLPNNLSFTRTVNSKEYTLADVVNRCIASVSTIAAPIEADDSNAVFNAVAPDFVFQNRSLAEALMEIGRYISAIPYLDYSQGNAVIKWQFLVGEETELAVEDISNTIEPQLLTGGFRAETSNLVAKGNNTSAVTTGYLSLRGPEGEIISSDNAFIQLPTTAYKIEEIDMLSTIHFCAAFVENELTYAKVKQIGPYIRPIFQQALVSKEIYDTLPPVHSLTDINGTKLTYDILGKYKDTAIYWEKDKILVGGSNSYKKILVKSAASVIVNLLQTFQNSDWLGLDPHEVFGEEYDSISGYTTLDIGIGVLDSSSLLADYQRLSDHDKPSNYTFNTKYQQLIAGTVAVANTTDVSRIPVNQQTSVVDSVAWGTNLQETLNRTGNPTTTLVETTRTMPNKLGTKTTKGYIVSEERTNTLSTFTAKYEISKQYHRISQYTALDSKWRESSIPVGENVNRTLEYNQYATLSTSSNSTVGTLMVDWLKGLNKVYGANVAEVAVDNNINLLMPVSSIAVGNTARLAFDFKSNVSAGAASLVYDVDGKEKSFSTPVSYTNGDGYSDDIEWKMWCSWRPSADSDSLPKRNPDANYELRYPATDTAAVHWEKDSREAMSVVHNIHFLDNFTQDFVAMCPLVAEGKINDGDITVKGYTSNNTPINAVFTVIGDTPRIMGLAGCVRWELYINGKLCIYSPHNGTDTTSIGFEMLEGQW